MVDTNPTSNVLALTALAKNFGSLQILKSLGLTVSENQSVAILGPSGSGKSTLLHIAGLMEKPTQGQVSIRGQLTANMSESDKAKLRRDKIGFLFQFHYLLPDFNVLENVLIPSRLAGDDLAEAEKEARNILDRLGLSHRLDHRPFQLSGGEQQRTALARAIIRKPDLILCDEPTGNLDPHTAEKVMDYIWSEIQTNRLAAIIVTHNEKIANLASRKYHLWDGSLVEKIKDKN